ncbi:hypothetical protein ACFQS7_27915 [Dankookia sp. GCM10030260]|uniref:hypothetical protein n=1 Tax=Dankookia sp. GCM10030260 TaxID=3273390 RepID=UPI0036138B9A
MSSHLISLVQLSRELGQVVVERPPSYRTLYSQILDGFLPAERMGREWAIRRSDLPQCARLLGLTLKALPDAKSAPDGKTGSAFG